VTPEPKCNGPAHTQAPHLELGPGVRKVVCVVCRMVVEVKTPPIFRNEVAKR
jgi:hypothetical protein